MSLAEKLRAESFPLVQAEDEAVHERIAGYRERLALDDRFRWEVAEALTLPRVPTMTLRVIVSGLLSITISGGKSQTL